MFRSPVRRSEPGRTKNVIIFGLAESETIVATKGAVNEIFQFVAGHAVGISDLFRLGRLNHSAGSESRPRPILVKLNSVWDQSSPSVRAEIKGFPYQEHNYFYVKISQLSKGRNVFAHVLQ